ncbi:MAG: phosphoesterase, partial [Chloroflexota bacterium]
YFSLFDINLLVDNTFPRALGLVTDIVLTILTINAVILLFLLTLSIPLYIIFRDVKRTLRRFGVVGADSLEFDPDSNLPYFERARTVFSENPDVAVYVFGHTHDALLQKEGDHLIINTGTWLKILHRVTVRFGYLPPVYVPTFRLNYFKIYADQGQVAVEYVEMPKSIKNELTWLQQLVIWGRQIPEGRPIPKKVVI